MAFIRKLLPITLAVAIAIIASCPAAISESALVPKTTVNLFVSDSSSEELLNTNSVKMIPGDSLNFYVSAKSDGAGNDPISYKIEGKSVINAVNRTSDGRWSIKALKEGTCKMIFCNIIRTTPLTSGDAKLELTFICAYDELQGVSLNTDSATVKMGKTLKLSSTVKPATANPNVKWTSSDTSVAKVNSNGIVTPVSRGQAVITCTTVDESIFATCTVTVIPKLPDPESISLSHEAFSLLKGKKQKLVATIMPLDANKNVVWTTSDPSVAKVNSSGVVNAVKPGTATITCTTKQIGLTVSCDVTVINKYPDPESLTLDQTSISLVKGAKQKLKAEILPIDANKALIWSSSAKGIAKVSSTGVITAVKPGTAVITCKTKQGGLSEKCEVTVTPKS